MTEKQIWSANKTFLDEGIAEKAKFLLSTSIDELRAGTYLEKEINYILKNGYRLSDDATMLIPK